MRKAELIITLGHWSGHPSQHCVGFDSAEFAKSEFNRIEGLLKKRADKGNDVPKFINVEGITKLTCEFDAIRAVGFADLEKLNEHEKGVKEEYPYLHFKHP